MRAVARSDFAALGPERNVMSAIEGNHDELLGLSIGLGSGGQGKGKRKREAGN